MTFSDRVLAFRSVSQRDQHQSLDHHVGQPVLYVCGKPLASDSIYRSPIADSDVQLFRFSTATVQVDGSRERVVTESEIRRQFTQSGNSTWVLELINIRSSDGATSKKRYTIRFRIPSEHDLTQIDALFDRIFGVSNPTLPDPIQFLKELPLEASANAYGAALGDYILAIRQKEERHPSYSSLGFNAIHSKLVRAFDVLRHFDRPLASAISAAIQFNLNDFSYYRQSSSPSLDQALRYLSMRANRNTNSDITNAEDHCPKTANRSSLYPVDEITYQLLLACCDLFRNEMLSSTSLRQLKNILNRPFLVNSLDVAKLHVVCAEGYAALGNTIEAREHMQLAISDHTFREWARRRVEEL